MFMLWMFPAAKEEIRKKISRPSIMSLQTSARSFRPENRLLLQIRAISRPEEQIEDFKNFVEEQGCQFFCISAATRKGIEPLVHAISQKLDELPPIKRFEVNYVPVMPDKDENKWKFDITVDEDGVYVVEADWLVKVLGMVNIEDEESLGYFQRVLRQSGIIDRLEEMGINEGILSAS